MATRQFTRDELLNSERFLAQLAGENVPDGDFGEGTNLRDLTIRAIAATVMYVRSEGDEIRALSELNSIRQIEDETEKRQAAVAYASNLFLTLGGGGRSRGFVEISLSSQSSGVIPVGTRFLAGTLVFFLDSAVPYSFSAANLRMVTDAATAEVTYVFQAPIIAVSVGEQFNIDARLFTAWDPFFAGVVGVQSLNRFTGGTEEETVDEFIDRVEDAVTTRNLLTTRAITTVLPEEFPSIQSLQIIEAGDSEMTRDIAPLLTPGLNIHTGGSTDIYAYTEVTALTTTLTIGADVQTVNGPLDTFIDLDLDYRSVDWRGRVREGDILHLLSAKSNEGNLYTIVEVDSFYVRVQPLIPFKEARPLIRHGGLLYENIQIVVPTRTLSFGADITRFTESDVGAFIYLNDGTKGIYLEIESVGQFTGGFAADVVVLDPDSELATLDTSVGVDAEVYSEQLEYSIGNNHPNYDNKVERRTTGRITRAIRAPGAVLLPSGPLYRLKEVVLLDPTDPNADPLAGGVLFTDRVDEPPTVSTSPPEYQVVSKRIDHAQSYASSMWLRLGPVDGRTGDNGIFSAVVDASADFTSATANFTTADVGLFILITAAVNQVNLGLYRIDSYISATKVRVTKSSSTFEFEDIITNPLLAEARLEWTIDARFIYDEQALRVEYETLIGFDSIAEYVDAGDDRVVAASTLARAPHPIYVSFQLQYQLKPLATTDIDVDVAARFLAAYIRDFPAFDVLNVGDIIAAFREEYKEQVGNVKQPLTADYYMVSPDGSLVYFQSTDEIVMSEALTLTAADAERFAVAAAHGVSDRTIKYLSFEDLITVLRV
jgi:hypothetical protein